jgi:hypothetical protein
LAEFTLPGGNTATASRVPVGDGVELVNVVDAGGPIDVLLDVLTFRPSTDELGEQLGGTNEVIEETIELEIDSDIESDKRHAC